MYTYWKSKIIKLYFVCLFHFHASQFIYLPHVGDRVLVITSNIFYYFFYPVLDMGYPIFYCH